MHVDRFIEDSLSIRSPDVLTQLYKNTLLKFDYDQLIFTFVTDHPSIGIKAQHGLISTYPEDWIGHYTARSYAKYDPVLRAASAARYPLLWSEICANASLTKKQKRVMDESEEAGLRKGLGIPIFGCQGEVAGIGLASKDGQAAPTLAVIRSLQAITYQFYIQYCQCSAQEDYKLGKSIYLTPREKDILTYCAEGKGDAVIAEILGISYDTVRFHMKNIFQKLNVSERTMAAVIAIRHGAISPYNVFDDR